MAQPVVEISIRMPKLHKHSVCLLKSIVKYRKVVSSILSWLVPHFHIFRLFMKGKSDAYVLCPKDSKLNSSLLTTRDFTVV